MTAPGWAIVLPLMSVTSLVPPATWQSCTCLHTQNIFWQKHKKAEVKSEKPSLPFQCIGLAQVTQTAVVWSFARKRKHNHHRLVEIERHLWRSPAPAPQFKQGHLESGSLSDGFRVSPRMEILKTSLGHLFQHSVTLMLERYILVFKGNSSACSYHLLKHTS